MRERMLAVIQGREHDRVPCVQCVGIAAPNAEVWSLIRRQNLDIIRWSAVHRQAAPNCRFASEEIHRGGPRGVCDRWITPAGTLTEERLLDPVYGSSAARERDVREPADYAVLLAYLRDVVVREDIAHHLRGRVALGGDGLPMVAVYRTLYPQLWVRWVRAIAGFGRPAAGARH